MIQELVSDFWLNGEDLDEKVRFRVALNQLLKDERKGIYLGKTIQLWEIKITDQEGQLISISKLTTYTRIKKNDGSFFIMI